MRVRMPSSQLGRYRLYLAVVVIVITIVKFWVAAHTFGTGDVRRWEEFAEGVAQAGPVDVYRLHFGSPYNHPPLIGYMLGLINVATRHGLSFPVAIRIPAISADVVTPFLILELLRKRRGLLESFAAATSVALSPVMFIISGFHGNTDPLFMMFALLSVYLLVDKRMPELAGLSIVIAMSVKIVPVVIVPALFAFALRAGWRSLLRFALASGALLALTWGPVVLRVWKPFRENVLAYEGGGRHWGLLQLGRWLGNPPAWGNWFAGPGRFVVVFIVAGFPAALVLWRPRLVVEAAALALTGLLALSPAGATQYLVWALAPAYLLNFWGATAYNIVAGGFLFETYTRWSGRFLWYFAHASPPTQGETIAAIGVWAVLVIVVVAGIRRCLSSPQPLEPAGALSLNGRLVAGRR